MDGRSILPLLVDASNTTLWAELSPAAQRHLRQLGTKEAVTTQWRTHVLFEHYFFSENIKCMANCSACSADCRVHDSNCADAVQGATCWATHAATWAQDPHDCTQQCYPTETRANNFAAIRHTRADGEDSLYAEFHNGNLDEAPIDFTFAPPSHVEHFNVENDPWMMRNLHYQRAPTARDEEVLRAKLHAYLGCQGDACP